MVRWLICLLPIGILIGQDDGLPPNFVYLDPIEDFYAGSPIDIEIIITDRNEIKEVTLFYKFDDAEEFSKKKMHVSYQPVIYNVEIPIDEVEPGLIQYYFWAIDEFDNGATWPSGGEDMPTVLPVYTIRQEKSKPKEIARLVDGFQAPENLEDNIPYYLGIGMLAPFFEVTQEEGVPIIVISVYDVENIIIVENTKLFIDGNEVPSFNSPDMITHIPQDPFESGYHIVRYESINNLGEILFKEFSFFMHEKKMDEIKEQTWKDAIKLKGNLALNTDYDKSPNRPIDTHKINSSVKFKLGEYKFNLSGLMNTHIFDTDAREEATHRQPSNRLKIKMNSPYINFFYGDNTPEYSEFSLKGTRVRGSSTKLKWGTWETSFVSGETKHWVRNGFSQISPWDSIPQYTPGDMVYSNGVIWESKTINIASLPGTDTLDWTDDLDSDYSLVSNDGCEAINPVLYGLDSYDSGGEAYAIWTGEECEEVILYSRINMLTGEDGVEKGVIYLTVEECLQQCKTPITYEKGFPIRQLQGFRTSKDFFEHAKFGISAIRSWDVRDETLTPYSIFHEGYTYEGNVVAAGDFSFHFNHDKTVLSGEYGLSMTIDQTYSDTVLLRNMSNIPESLSLYSFTDWTKVDYCYQNECVDIDGNDTINVAPEFVEGASQNDSLWSDYNSAKDKINDFEKILGFRLNDDIITGYSEGRGVSGLTGPELEHLIEGGLDSLYLLLKKPAFKVAFRTPIPLYFTELNFQTEFNQAPLNYLSHGSPSIQKDVRIWKNKVAFKLLKNQASFSFGYDRKIKSPWDPESEVGGEVDRSITDTKSGSIGMSFRNWPGINYSIRLQERKDLLVYIDSTLLLQKPIVGQKKLITHTIAPSYKLKLGDIAINLNGNVSFVNDLDELSDTTGCYEILNSTKGEIWGGVKNDECDINEYYFEGNNNYPFNNSGSHTSTYTSALSFSFPILSMNLGWGMSINSPNDLRQSKTVITVMSTKLGYKYFDKKLNLTVGGNYVIGYKGGNEFWDSGEQLTNDWNRNEAFDLISSDEFNAEGDSLIADYNGNNEYDEYEADTFIDNIELDNSKLSLKIGMQYNFTEPKIAIGLDLDYAKAVDNLKTEQNDPVFKAKLAIKYGF